LCTAQEIIAAPAADVSGRYLALTQLKLCVSKNWRPRLDGSCAPSSLLTEPDARPASLPENSTMSAPNCVYGHDVSKIASGRCGRKAYLQPSSGIHLPA